MIFREQEKEVIENKLHNFLNDLGYILVEASIIKQNNTSRVRIFIHSKNGVSIEDCLIVSKAIGKDFPAEEMFGENYTLEVSSPGIGRLIKNIREYMAFAGEKVELFVKNIALDIKKISGTIKKVEENNIFIDNDKNEEIMINLENITKGKLYDNKK